MTRLCYFHCLNNIPCNYISCFKASINEISLNVGKSKLEKFFSLIFNQLFWCSDFFHCCQIICLWWCQVDIPVNVVMFSENITIISEAEFCQNDPWNNGFLTDIKGSFGGIYLILSNIWLCYVSLWSYLIIKICFFFLTNIEICISSLVFSILINIQSLASVKFWNLFNYP